MQAAATPTTVVPFPTTRKRGFELRDQRGLTLPENCTPIHRSPKWRPYAPDPVVMPAKTAEMLIVLAILQQLTPAQRRAVRKRLIAMEARNPDDPEAAVARNFAIKAL